MAKTWGFLCACMIVASCGESSGVSWAGEEPHVVVSGFIDGESIDLDLRGASAELAGLECTREYEVPVVGGNPDFTMARNVEIELEGRVEVNGEMRQFQIELKRHNTQDDPVGTEIRVIPRDELNPPDVNGDTLWLEWEWKDADGNDLYEQAAQSGTVTVQLQSGTPDDSGVIIPEGEGAIGFTIDAYWSPSERMRISISAPCLDIDTEEVIQ